MEFRFLFSLLFIFTFTAGAANAEPGQSNADVNWQSIEGSWQGVLNSPVGKLRLVLKVSKAADGTLKATRDSTEQISIHNSGHYFRFERIEDMFVEFLSKGSAKGLNDSCVKEIERPPFITKLPPQLAK